MKKGGSCVSLFLEEEGMENLEEKWKQLNLSTDEDNEIYVDEEVLREEIQKGKNSIIGKLHSDRNINKEMIRATMNKLWRTAQPFTIMELGSNTFVFSFALEEDMQKIMVRRPWLFETSLLSLKAFDGYTPAAQMDFSKEIFWINMHNLPIDCMNERIGRDIRNAIGKVIKCDVQQDGSGWGNVLRVCIEIELQRPISRGRTINVQGKRLWIPLTYERLLRICFRCGCIIHEQGTCAGDTLPATNNQGQFGRWLKAESGRNINYPTESFTSLVFEHPEQSTKENLSMAPPQEAALEEADRITQRRNRGTNESGLRQDGFPPSPATDLFWEDDNIVVPKEPLDAEKQLRMDHGLGQGIVNHTWAKPKNPNPPAIHLNDANSTSHNSPLSTMHICQDLNYPRVTFEGDCIQVINVANRHQDIDTELFPIVYDIHYLLSINPGWSVHYAHREAIRLLIV